MPKESGRTEMRFRECHQWEYSSYLAAKAAMIRLWTPLGHRFPVCAVCGEPTVSPRGHHIFLSRHFVLKDIRNLVPVCNPCRGVCHTLAHSGLDYLATQRLYYVVGHGDPEAGRDIVLSAKWLKRSMRRVPEVDKEIELWKKS